MFVIRLKGFALVESKYDENQRFGQLITLRSPVVKEPTVVPY